jgi:UDP-N-acetylglucosamine transferase subunit ALG13
VAQVKGIVLKAAYLFVTVGSTDFDPLVCAVDALVPVLGRVMGMMQIGHGQYQPVNLPYFRFAPSLQPYYTVASLVVAHGGLASTMEVLKQGIPLVSVSNADRYDQHQDELLEALAAEGYLHWCRALDQLEETILRAQDRPLRRYEAPACRIQLVIEAYLQRLPKVQK